MQERDYPDGLTPRNCSTEHTDRIAEKIDGADPGIAPHLVGLPPDVVARAQSLERLVGRCATYRELARRTPFLEADVHKLWHRVGRRVSQTQHLVYGVVRMARALIDPATGEQYAGAFISHADLAAIVGCHPDTARKATYDLVELELLKIGWHYVPTPEQYEWLGFTRVQTCNAYTLGAASQEPRRATLPRPKPAGKTAGKTTHPSGSGSGDNSTDIARAREARNSDSEEGVGFADEDCSGNAVVAEGSGGVRLRNGRVVEGTASEVVAEMRRNGASETVVARYLGVEIGGAA